MSEWSYVLPADEHLIYSGRIQWNEIEEPILIYPCSYVAFRFAGTKCDICLTNEKEDLDTYLGIIIDGKMEKKFIKSGRQIISIAKGLEFREHTVMIYKRMDACHQITLHWIRIDIGNGILSMPPLPERKIEVYGDSVSAGEVSEAIEYVKKQDPPHNGEFSNSYYSYSWIVARKLGAQLHNISQGGIALMDNTGWFHEPHGYGMESIYDKVCYNDTFHGITKWDFSLYQPHVVIVAIGQNDAHPVDYMKYDFNGQQANIWRQHYKEFIEALRANYPDALIILTTTILEHDKNWDKSIEQVCEELADEKIVHFLYSENGTGTPGHVRISEAQQMAEELSEYINTFGEKIWEHSTSLEEDSVLLSK